MLLKTAKRTEPTRYSELNTFSQCRKKWMYAYHEGLAKKRNSLTIERGNFGHLALAALDSKQDVAMHLAVKKKELIDKFASFEFDGEELFDVEDYKQTIDDLMKSVLRQTNRYRRRWSRWEDVLAIEQQFLIRVPRSPIMVHGTFDGIVQDENGIWVLERKWFKSAPRTPEMFDLDGQMAIYYLAAKSLGIKINGVLVDQIGPTPRDPNINKDGSVSKVAFGDWTNYSDFLIDNNYDLDDYQDMKEKLPEWTGFHRDYVTFSEKQVQNYNEDLLHKIREMVAVKKRIYTCDDRMRCSWCSFRELCIEDLQGGDTEYLRNEVYEKRTDPYNIELKEDYPEGTSEETN